MENFEDEDLDYFEKYPNNYHYQDEEYYDERIEKLNKNTNMDNLLDMVNNLNQEIKYLKYDKDILKDKYDYICQSNTSLLNNQQILLNKIKNNENKILIYQNECQKMKKNEAIDTRLRKAAENAEKENNGNIKRKTYLQAATSIINVETKDGINIYKNEKNDIYINTNYRRQNNNQENQIELPAEIVTESKEYIINNSENKKERKKERSNISKGTK